MPRPKGLGGTVSSFYIVREGQAERGGAFRSPLSFVQGKGEVTRFRSAAHASPTATYISRAAIELTQPRNNCSDLSLRVGRGRDRWLRRFDRGRLGRQPALDQLSALHDDIEFSAVLKDGHVPNRVAVNHQQIGDFAGCDRAEFVPVPKQSGAVSRGPADHV